MSNFPLGIGGRQPGIVSMVDESLKPMATLVAAVGGITHDSGEAIPCAHPAGAMRIIRFALRTNHARTN